MVNVLFLNVVYALRPLVAWRCVGCCLSCMGVVSSPVVFAITERSEMGLYDVPMFMSLVWFWNYVC